MSEPFLTADTSAAISAISSVVYTIFTLAIVVLTALLAAENRRLRKAGTDPEVVPFLSTHPDGNGGIIFNLANIGQGPALRVEYKLIGDEADFAAHQVALTNDAERAPIGVLPQGEKIAALFGVGYVLYGSDAKSGGQRLKPFDVAVTCYNLSGQRKISSHKLDIAQFAGLRGIATKPAIREIAEALKNIERRLGASGGLSLIDATSASDTHVKKLRGDD
ncbi:hypothetical protein [Mesorhizobium sp. NZP2077]|uniref:hypothetical protein n=1 Tax=Mesorhizobium sp. NZP2077 TaxID=2483404 RepID=UPI001551971C|nr:hypothetical protein [Mesorhizobium sp. NZP2077]QKC85772.1 hypothetical protein EB232_33335 [Mesorhizobium sp. NZP2077]QKD19411.1 hypothetical protein HGP13_32995 [Mesorhizobium sp. NZP2077]